MKTYITSAILCLTLGLIAFSTLHAYSINWYNPAYTDNSLLTNHNNDYAEAIQNESCSYTNWDLTYNKLEISVNPVIYYITGSVYFEFTSLVDNLDSIVIDLTDTMKINSLASNGIELSYTCSNHQVVIKLPETLSKGEKSSFTIKYEGIPMALWDTAYDMQPVNQIVPSGFNNYKYLQMFTQSEPYNARGWWPCKQSLVDKIDSIDIVVEVPNTYEVASNGLLFSKTTVGSKSVFLWKHRYPIATYLVFFSAAPYAIYSDWATLSDGTKVEILNYVYPDECDSLKEITPIAAEFIEYYSNLLVDYPFKNEKYGHAQVTGGVNMEHQTMSTMSSFTDWVIIHELSHQWFGDYITCGSWQDVWLNEGFATFFQVTFQGRAGKYQGINAWASNQWSSKLEPEKSLFVKDTTNERNIFDSRVAYSKGASILYMLKGLLGEKTFYKGLNNYLNDSRLKYGFASTKHFCENMEAAADTSLTEFFNDWVYGEGFPIYNIKCNKNGKHLDFDLTQSQSSPNSPFFEMDIPVSVYNDTIIETIWLKNRAESESYEFDFDYIPTKILVNEYQYVLGKFTSTYTDAPLYQTSEFSAYYSANEKRIIINSPDNSEGQLSVFNSCGQKIETQKCTENKSSISTTTYQPGIYFLLFKSNKQSYSTKVTVY